MANLFLKCLNMSIAAGWLVLVVIFLRVLLRKASKSLIIAMWGMVGIRLICPFSIHSIFSLMPSAQMIPTDIVYSEVPAIQSGIPAVNQIMNTFLADSLSPKAYASVNPLQVIVPIISAVWIIGVVGMLSYALISYLCLLQKLREAVCYEDNVYLCDHIATPFILGIVHPRIFIPSSIDQKDFPYVTAHERIHLKRYDHWWKPLSFLLLAVYWMNPLIWIAYILFGKDMELACDEMVIAAMGSACKKAYSEALINCSAPKRISSISPLAFGEIGIKARIRAILGYKKPSFWITAAGCLMCFVAALGFLTDPPMKTSMKDDLAQFIDQEILMHHHSQWSDTNYCCENFEILGVETSGKTTTVYMWVLYTEYTYEQKLIEAAGAHIPTVITVKEKENASYELIEYWEPRDGSLFIGDIKEKFPISLQGKAIDSQRYIEKQSQVCQEKAMAYFGIMDHKD